MIELTSPTEHTTTDFTLRSLDIDQDCEKLAAMWNASDDQWPGTWSKGVPVTAQRIREWLSREKRIDALVWDTGDAIAGYCSLWEWMDEPNVTYIAVLNVAPAFQKQSLARKFLTRYVERVIELGSIRVDLHTWAGNLKAVPLYKKCGYFWMPGTSVHMLNFLPTILTMPSAQPYFAKHNWYSTLKRELTQAEDDERWEGMKVFTYHFEEDGEALTVWADREARTITAVETDTFFAAAIATELEPAGGLPTTMRWKLRNKGDRPMQVSLIAGGTAELGIDHRATVQLAPGETTTLEAPVRIAAKLPDMGHGKPAPRVRSLFVIDGEVLELGTGLRPRAAVEVSTHPEYVTLLPDVPQTVELQLHSHLSHAAEVTVSIAPEPGLQTDWTQQSVSLAADSRSGLPVRLEADQGGVFDLQVAITFEQDGAWVHLPGIALAIFVLPLGGVLGAHADGKLRIENDTARLVVQARGAECSIFHRPSDEWLTTHSGWAAPPAFPSEYRGGEFELSLEREPGRVIAIASMASREHPDFVLRKRVGVSASPVVRIDYDFDNLGAEARRFQLLHLLDIDDERATLTLPLVAGLGQGSWDVFPGMPDDEFKKATSYAEQWAAITVRAVTMGVLWSNDTEEIEWSWGMDAMTRLYDCPPQSRVRPAPLHLSIGEGDWRVVQRLWGRMMGQPVVKNAPLPEPRQPLTARLDPAVVVATDAGVEAMLLVEQLLSRKLNGTASLRLPEGWRSDTSTFDLVDVSWQQPHRTTLRLTTEGQPGAEIARLAVRSADVDADFDLPLIRLGDGRPVTIHDEQREGQRVLTIRNGHMEIDVAPSFGATMAALRQGGVDHLASPFPNVATLGWMSPWFGGVMPTIMIPDEWNFPGRLWQEQFAAEPLETIGEQSIVWRGARQSATLATEKLRGLQVEIDTLTVGGSPVVKQVLRVINTAPAVRRLEQVGFSIFVQPDGSRARTTLWGSRPIKASERIAFRKTGHWGAAQNPETGRCIALISPLPQVSIAGMGNDGGHLRLLSHFDVPANGAVEVVAYLVMADDLEQARHFAALKDLR